MNELLVSLKKDLLGRRMLPLLALAALLLAGATAYAVLGGGGSSSSSTVATVSGAQPSTPASLASPAPANPNQAVAETTAGAHYQRAAATRDPFVPLPQPKAKAANPTAKSGESKSSTSSGSGSKSSGSGGTTPSTPATPTPAPAKPKVVYHVAILFGPLPAPGENPKLTPYADLTRLTPLPQAKGALLVFSGVGASGKGAIFTLLQPAIVKGSPVCLPSTSQCEAIDVRAGEAVELDYLNAEGKTAPYELQVVSIDKREGASTASVRATARVSRAGRALLRRAALGITDRLRYSASRDVVLLSK
ncbi:MAG TPA: hypothetical protein VID29_02345 [Solirubrobacteraceae bacterium]|jgi:hypothetical protein